MKLGLAGEVSPMSKKHTAIDRLQEARRIYELASEAISTLTSLQESLYLTEQRAREISWRLNRPLWLMFAYMMLAAFAGALLAAGTRELFRWALDAVLSWWGG